jgi:hypothetical protein
MLALLLGIAASCAPDNPRFVVNYAPGFVKEGVRVSIFGVLRDGRMNPEAWEDFGPRFSAALRKDTCEIAIGTGLRARHLDLFSAVDSFARADGLTDELLDKFGPAADGDSILVITMNGHPSHADGGVSEVGTTHTTAAQIRRPRSMPHASTADQAGDPSSFEVSASLFSKRQHESVAMVAMTSKGTTEEVAIQKFAAKLAAAFPGAACAGWKADLGVDGAAIEHLAKP